MRLGIKLYWTKVGKPVVTLLVERSNNFHARLGKYQEAGAIVNTEDCSVELEQMYTDIQQASLQLRSSKNWVTSPSVKKIFMDSQSLSQSPK